MREETVKKTEKEESGNRILGLVRDGLVLCFRGGLWLNFNALSKWFNGYFT